VEETLMKEGTFLLPACEALLKSDIEYEAIWVDATESPMERPKNKNGSILGRKSDTP